MDLSREFDLLNSYTTPVETQLQLELIIAKSQNGYIFLNDNLIKYNAVLLKRNVVHTISKILFIMDDAGTGTV